MRRSAALLLAGVMLASCVAAGASQPRLQHPPAEPPRPRPGTATLRPSPSPQPPATPQARFAWEDAPLTPGGWRYVRTRSGSSASYGAPGRALFELRCTAPRAIQIVRSGAPGALTIRTSSTARTLTGTGGAFALPADDPLLDAMAFSRGRFAVETQGAAPLVIPSWPELGRVIEDCRR